MNRSTQAPCRCRFIMSLALVVIVLCSAIVRSTHAQRVDCNYDNGCSSDSNWGCDDNWDFSGVSNNDTLLGVTYNVTLDGSDAVVLDDFDFDGVVEIETLNMLQDSILQTGNTDLVITGAMTMNDRCNYRGAFNPNVLLQAGSLTMLEGDLFNGPWMFLINDMQVFFIGEFFMDGSNYSGGFGSCTFSDLQTYGVSEVFVNDDFTVVNAVKINYDSSQNMCLVGNWNNFSRFPALMDLDSFQITLATSCTFGPALDPLAGGDGIFDDSLPLGFDAVAAYEVAGMDFGPILAFVDNYGVAQVVVEDGKEVTFQDQFDNDDLGQKPCIEAMYVNSLVLGVGSTVIVDNCRIYYIQLIGDDADIQFNGCG